MAKCLNHLLQLDMFREWFGVPLYCKVRTFCLLLIGEGPKYVGQRGTILSDIFFPILGKPLLLIGYLLRKYVATHGLGSPCPI